MTRRMDKDSTCVLMGTNMKELGWRTGNRDLVQPIYRMDLRIRDSGLMTKNTARESIDT